MQLATVVRTERTDWLHAQRQADTLDRWLDATSVDMPATPRSRSSWTRRSDESPAAESPDSPRIRPSPPSFTAPSRNSTHETPGWLSDRAPISRKDEEGGRSGFRGAPLASTTLKPSDRAAMDVGMRVLHSHRASWLSREGAWRPGVDHGKAVALRRLRDPVADNAALSDR